MRSTLLILAGVVTTALFLAGQRAQAQTYVLPQDPTQPVITLDYQGNRLKRIDDAPTLSILASGTVVMPQSYAHTMAYEDQISEAELQELLDFIIRENRFFDYDAEAVEAKLSVLERQPLPVHFSTTVIGVHLGDRSKEIRCPALGHGPMVEETRRLLAIKQRLDQLMSVVKLGGRDELAKWLELANSELVAKSLGDSGLVAKSLSDSRLVLKSLNDDLLRVDDLESGGQRADGSIYVRFVRRDGEKTTSVTIDVTADGEFHVAVAQDDP